MMMLRVLVLLTVAIVGSVSGQCPAVPAGGCNICGYDVSGDPLCVQSPDVFLTEYSTTCGVFECEERNDMIETFFCELLQFELDPACNCGTPTPGTAPTNPPLLVCPDDTPAPVAPSQPPVTPAPDAPVTPAPVIPPTPFPKVDPTPAPIVPPSPGKVLH